MKYGAIRKKIKGRKYMKQRKSLANNKKKKRRILMG
jgi:hypothetical protein